jgi:hypothetical protein
MNTSFHFSASILLCKVVFQLSLLCIVPIPVQPLTRINIATLSPVSICLHLISMATRAHGTYALPEGLRYYVLRGDAMSGSVMVPLVPVDQLPFQLQGIPRRLTHRQISDGDWKFCSETNEVPSALSVQAPTATSFPAHSISTTKSRYLAPDHHVRVQPQAIPESNLHPLQSSRLPPNVSSSPEIPRPNTTATFERSSLTDTFASIYQKDALRLGYHPPHPSGIEPDPSKKEYCTYWIKTGECDWTAIGCKFKHEMPSVEKLRELGFVRGIPRWWKEKSAIVTRPPTWMQRRLAGNDDAEQTGAMPEARVFPDPSTFRTKKTEEYDLLNESVQQPRDILKRNPSPKQTTAERLTPPPAPIQEPVRRTSHVSDLLIDLEDTRAPPPSPQSSRASAASTGSSETQVPPSRTSTSPPSSPIPERKSSLLSDSMTPPRTVIKKTTDKEPSVRRHSQLSWASDTEDETPLSTKPTTKPAITITTKPPRPPQQRRKPTPRSSNNKRLITTLTTNPLTSTKPHPGLSASKHATTDNVAKNTANHGRNSNRKIHGNPGGEIDAPELHAKIEQLRRDAHQKDRLRKGAVTAVSAVGR